MQGEQIFKIAYSFCILFIPLSIGYIFKKYGFLKEEFSRGITASIITFLSPVIVCLSFWKLNLSHVRILTLPLVGAIISTLSILPALFFSKLHKLSRQRAGSYITSAMFSNVGYTLGQFLAFIFLGEEGFGLAVLYVTYFGMYLYTIGFHIAEYFGGQKTEGILAARNLKKLFTEPIRFMPLLGVLAGVALNLTGITRPEAFSKLNDILVPTATAGFLFAIGLTLRLRVIAKFMSECLTMSVIKFIYSPMIGLGLSYLLGFNKIMNSVPLKVVFILSVMPTGISSLTLANLFDLDQDLSNSVWIVTTILALLLLPVINLLLNIF